MSNTIDPDYSLIKNELEPGNKLVDASLWSLVEYFPQELADSLFSMWKGGHKPYVKQMEYETTDPTKPLYAGGMAPAWRSGRYYEYYDKLGINEGMAPDTVYIRPGNIEGFVAEMSHSFDKYMNDDDKRNLIADYYAKTDTVGLSLDDVGVDLNDVRGKFYQSYYDPNLDRNPKPHEYISHRIIEPWLWRKYNIGELLDSWLDNPRDEMEYIKREELE